MPSRWSCARSASTKTARAASAARAKERRLRRETIGFPLFRRAARPEPSGERRPQRRKEGYGGKPSVSLCSAGRRGPSLQASAARNEGRKVTEGNHRFLS